MSRLPSLQIVQIFLVRSAQLGYIRNVAAILLTQAATKFDLGSGTPKPHTSTTLHGSVIGWSDFFP
jgi:hypothetical protein